MPVGQVTHPAVVVVYSAVLQEAYLRPRRLPREEEPGTYDSWLVMMPLSTWDAPVTLLYCVGRRRRGVLKIADFGLARNFANDNNGKLTNRVITLWYRCVWGGGGGDRLACGMLRPAGCSSQEQTGRARRSAAARCN
jgi:hypothetical protein